jgi:hypothetical protein
MSSEEEAVAWLRAQIEARKSAAEVLAVALGGNWLVRLNDDDDFDFTVRAADIDDEPAADTWRRDAADHIAANDPRDVIARCEAELAILGEHAPADFSAYGERLCRRCRWDDDEPGRDDDAHHWVIYPCRTIRLLAGGYKHRAGYREEDWKQ